MDKDQALKVGDWVVYYDGNRTPQLGRVKADANIDNVFVVYNCAGEWDKFEDYTAACSDRACLTLIKYDGE